MADRINELEVLVTEARATKQATSNQYIDLSAMDYRHDADTGFHVMVDRQTNEEFVLQSKTALKQLCRMIKVPHAFVIKNPNFLNDGIMNFWIDRALTGGDTGTKKAKLASNKIIRYFTSNTGQKHVRAILDEDIIPVDNLDLLNIVEQSFSSDSVSLDFASGLGMEDEDFHARFVTHHQFDPGDGLMCNLGFHLRSSELGIGALSLDALLFRQICSNGAVITYGNNSYFSSKFKDVMVEDLKDILANCVSRMQDDLDQMVDKLKASIAYNVTNDEVRGLFTSLKHRRGFNRTFVESVEGHALDPNISNFWQVTNTITRAAQDLPDNHRIKYETLAGNLLELDLPKLA